jgi:DNA polymerase III epsilon subunit-like protein
VDVETTATIPGRHKIIELGICLFEYDRQSGRIYKVFGSWEWLEDLGFRSRVIATTRISIVDS